MLKSAITESHNKQMFSVARNCIAILFYIPNKEYKSLYYLNNEILGLFVTLHYLP